MNLEQPSCVLALTKIVITGTYDWFFLMVQSQYPTPRLTDTDTNKMGSEPNENLLVSLSVLCEHLHTNYVQAIFICLCIAPGVGQCDHTIRDYI